MDPDKNTSGEPIMFQLFQRCSIFFKPRLLTPVKLPDYGYPLLVTPVIDPT